MFSGSRKSSITKLFAIIVSDKKPFRKNFYSRSLTGTKVHLQFKYKHVQADNLHNVKIVQIWSFFWFVFSRIQLNVLKTFRRLYLYTFHAVLNKRPAQRKRHKDSRSVFWTVISFAKKPHHKHLTGPKIGLWNMRIYSKLMLSHHNDGRVFSVNF